MAEENIQELQNNLKEKGLTCPGLRSKIKKQVKDAQDFRRLNFNKLADAEEQVASALKQLNNKVCRKI